MSAAVLIGGVSFKGGDSGIFATLLGVMFLGPVQNALTINGVSKTIRLLPLDESAAIVRAALTERFPGTRFSVETRRGGRTSWILVTWEGDPNVQAVREETLAFEGIRWSPASRRRRRVFVTSQETEGLTRLAYEPSSVVLHRRRSMPVARSAH